MMRLICITLVAGFTAFYLLLAWGEPPVTSWRWWVLATFGSITVVGFGYMVNAVRRGE